MTKKLKIDADLSSVQKSILDLSNVLKRDLGSSKINIFSKESEKLLKGEAKVAMEQLNKSAKDLKSQLENQAKVLKDTTKNTKEYAAEMQKLLNISEKMYQVEKARGQFGAIAQGGMAGKAPGGMGSLLGGLAGKLGPLALAGFAGSRLFGGYGEYSGGMGTRLSLRGRGVTDLSTPGASEMAGAGLNTNTLLQQRLAGMDAFGAAGATNEAVLNRSKFERNYGVNQGTLTNIGSGLRQTMGGTRANEAVMKLQASLIASGIEDAIGPYLSTVSNLLSSINENGLTDSAEILGSFAELIKNTKESPERISKSMETIDSTLRNSTGERNAFMQMAFARAGIGGTSIGGTQAAIRTGGLFGADLSALTATQQKTLSGWGSSGAGAARRAGAILNQVQTSGINFGEGATEKQLTQAGRFGMRFLGAKNESQGIELLNLLKQMSQGKDVKDKIEKLMENPELKNLENINTSAEGQLRILEDISKTLKTELGEKLVPFTALIYKGLNQIDENISRVVEPFAMVAKGIGSVLSFLGVGEGDGDKSGSYLDKLITGAMMLTNPGAGMMSAASYVGNNLFGSSNSTNNTPALPPIDLAAIFKESVENAKQHNEYLRKIASHTSKLKTSPGTGSSHK